MLKKDIELKNLVAISAKNINKKRKYKINRKTKTHLKFLKKKKLVGQSDGVSKSALKNKIVGITQIKL